MKVHFIGDLAGSKDDYKKIVAVIDKLGHELVTDHSVVHTMEDVRKESVEESELYAKKMRQWMKKADMVVVETTVSMLGAGYEIAVALQLGKPVIVVYRPERENAPHVLKGMASDKLQVSSYNDKTLEEVLTLSLEYASDQIDTRFNFFVSPAIVNYLNWVSTKKRLPRAVYLRRLIENDMKENKEYNEE